MTMKTEFYQQLCNEEARLQGLIDAIRLLKKDYDSKQEIFAPPINTGTPLPKRGRPSSIPTTKFAGKKLNAVATQYFNAFEKPIDRYERKLTQIQKVIYALREKTGRKLISDGPGLLCTWYDTTLVVHSSLWGWSVGFHGWGEGWALFKIKYCI